MRGVDYETQCQGEYPSFFRRSDMGLCVGSAESGDVSSGTFGFTAIRCMMGGLALLPLVIYMDSKKSREEKRQEAGKGETIKGAVWCGIVLTALVLFQQFGLPHTTVGKAGFITALYILLTPVMGIFMGKKAGRNLWIGVAVGLAGMYMLCLYEGISALTFGDLMMLGAAVMAGGSYTCDRSFRTEDRSCQAFIISVYIRRTYLRDTYAGV